MFGKTVVVTIDREGGTDKKTLVASKLEEVSLLSGVGHVFKSVIDDDIAVAGVAVPVAVLGSIYLSAFGTNRVLSGRFNLNPLSAG